MTDHKKRVDIVKIKMVKESTINYSPRKITSPIDALHLVQAFLSDSDRECFIVVALDSKSQPTAIELCSIGTLSSSLIHPREVFKMAILANACSIIIAHNHPSGDITPSDADLEVTKKLVQSGEILGISTKDHLIIGGANGKYLSFKEEDLI